jgi:hypothetical protein
MALIQGDSKTLGWGGGVIRVNPYQRLCGGMQQRRMIHSSLCYLMTTFQLQNLLWHYEKE